MEKDSTFRYHSLEAAQYIDEMTRHIESSKNISPYRSEETFMIEPVELVTAEPVRRRSESHNTTPPPAFRPNKVTACGGIENPEIFHNQSTIKDAMKLCEVCLVTRDCLEYAIKNKVTGVWGGTTEDERKDMKIKPRTK